MIDTSHLRTLLEKAKAVQDDTFDIRFEEVVSLVDQEKLDDASALILTIFSEGTIDIRLVMYLFYAQFMTEGVLSLKETLSITMMIMNDYWDKISPTSNSMQHFTSSLTWFFASIGKKLKRIEKKTKDKKPDEAWNATLQKLSPEGINELIQTTRSFTECLTNKIQEPSLNQYIQYISKWVESLKTVDVTEQTPLPQPVQPTPMIESSKKAPSLDEVLISSSQIKRLFQKIQAFEALIKKQNFEKAALVSDDIALIIKNFDPTLFFPKLFSKYFSLSAAHMDALSQQWENKGSLKWEALSRLYQTDLDEFIQW